jgi:AraC-like DNA-binding protein
MGIVEPILNIFTVLIFLGVVQALFLSLFFLFRGGEASVSNRYFGLLLFALAAVILEMLLGYSGYITRVIHLVDFSEPVNFTLGSLLYLAARTRIRPEEGFRPRQLLHLIPFVLYAVYHVPYLMQSGEFKELAWLEAWRAPDSDAAGAVVTADVDPLHIRAVVTELTMLHVFAYTAGTLRALAVAFRERGLSLWRRGGAELAWLRNFVLQFVLMGIGVVIVKATFPNDLGDYVVALIVTGIVYATSASVIGRSAFFSDLQWRRGRKYEKSALTSERCEEVLGRLKGIMAEKKPYLKPSITLSELAALVNVSPHHLSQVLNEAAGCTFHHYLARHRIEEAKRLLSGGEKDGLRIEEVAERVGYYSKSSFNTAFRRIIGVTPSQYRSSRKS